MKKNISVKLIGIFAALITIFVFITGIFTLDDLIKYFNKVEKKQNSTTTFKNEQRDKLEEKSKPIIKNKKEDNKDFTTEFNSRNQSNRQLKRYSLDTIAVDYNYKHITKKEKKLLEKKIN